MTQKGNPQDISPSRNIFSNCQGAFDMGKVIGSIPILGRFQTTFSGGFLFSSTRYFSIIFVEYILGILMYLLMQIFCLLLIPWYAEQENHADIQTQKTNF